MTRIGGRTVVLMAILLLISILISLAAAGAVPMVMGYISLLRMPTCPDIITEPCLITRNGSFTLGRSIRGDGLPARLFSRAQQPVIEIRPGVTRLSINCDGHSISNHDGYSNRGIAIYGRNVSNVDIFNCIIFGDGMMFGVDINNSAAPHHENITVRDCTISTTLIGVLINANSTTVSGNTLQEIGGQTLLGDAFPGAISVNGRATITRNVMRRFRNPFKTEVFGIACDNCYGAIIEDNLIENDVMFANSWAIWLNPGTYTIKGNIIRNFDFGFGLPGGTGSIAKMTYENVTTEVQVGYDQKAWMIH